jgi:hypothetical protein
VVLYINTWADLLEEQLLTKIKLPPLEEMKDEVYA